MSRAGRFLHVFTKPARCSRKTPHLLFFGADRRFAASVASAASTSTNAAAPPPTTSAKESSPVDPLISRIVDDISRLTLLQAADLVSELKTRLNIQEIAMPTAAAAAVPAAAAANLAAEEAPPEEKPKEKTIFSIKLESFAAGAKPKVIKEIKALVPNLTLIDAKKMVESAPKIIKENVPKEEAENLKAKFEALGAVITLE